MEMKGALKSKFGRRAGREMAGSIDSIDAFNYGLQQGMGASWP